jgi:hypothetical protein
MSEQLHDPLEERSRALFHDSVENLDFALRSRLTQARYAALEAGAGNRPWFSRLKMWTPAAGVTAAAVLGVALWLGSPFTHHSGMLAETQTNLEDLELVASTDEGAGDALEMMQDDIDFYAFADKAAASEPAA